MIWAFNPAGGVWLRCRHCARAGPGPLRSRVSTQRDSALALGESWSASGGDREVGTRVEVGIDDGTDGQLAGLGQLDLRRMQQPHELQSVHHGEDARRRGVDRRGFRDALLPAQHWEIQLSASAPTRDRSVKSVKHDAQEESALRTVCPCTRGTSGVSDAAEE